MSFFQVNNKKKTSKIRIIGPFPDEMASGIAVNMVNVVLLSSGAQ